MAMQDQNKLGRAKRWHVEMEAVKEGRWEDERKCGLVSEWHCISIAASLAAALTRFSSLEGQHQGGKHLEGCVLRSILDHPGSKFTLQCNG